MEIALVGLLCFLAGGAATFLLMRWRARPKAMTLEQQRFGYYGEM